MRERVKSLFAILSFLAIVIVPPAYILRTEHYEDYKLLSIAIGATCSFLFVWIDRKYIFSQEFLYDEKFIIKVFAFTYFIPVAGGFYYYSLFALLRDVALFAFNLSSIYESVVLTAIFTTASGIILYVFRQRQRVLYGLSEALVGVMAAVSHVTSGAPHDQIGNLGLYLGVLTAGIYLVVRGLDNVDQGLRSLEGNNFVKALFGHTVISANQNRRQFNRRQLKRKLPHWKRSTKNDSRIEKGEKIDRV